ncbi:unnamed protein product [Medioppia subpectinata]|uniref:Kelch domain-containing protein 10 n=1 Tax=Medioppia subpectinata TaxID=1979941 RepID=A0A7R9KMJ6_9ACAR|nr:unnamed protein product [Medioppia subpectinata]CAG2106368.1 unnamed protein product [Medioppia subpectinata]
MDDTNDYTFKVLCFRKIQIKVVALLIRDPRVDTSGAERTGARRVGLALRGQHHWWSGRPLFKELWRFSYVTREWTRVELRGQAPDELASHCAALVDTRYLFVFGGTGFPFGESSSNRLSVCNLSSGEWKCVTNSDDTDAPIEQYGQALAVDPNGDSIYVCGGTTGWLYSMSVHRFDLRSHRWHSLYSRGAYFDNDFPEPRYRHEIVVHENRLYVIGGGTSYKCYKLSKIPVFDVESRQWLAMETKNDLNVMANGVDGYPTRRRCHDCVRADEHTVYVIGGTNNVVIFDDVWRLDLRLMQWTLVPTRLPRAVYFHSASVSSTGRLSVFGGVVLWLVLLASLLNMWRTEFYGRECLYRNLRQEVMQVAAAVVCGLPDLKSVDEILIGLQIPPNIRQTYL